MVSVSRAPATRPLLSSAMSVAQQSGLGSSGLGDGLAEWLITGPDGAQMMLQMAYFGRDRRPVTMDLGPVLDLEDVVGWKVVALASRAEPRDFVDTSATPASTTPSIS